MGDPSLLPQLNSSPTADLLGSELPGSDASPLNAQAETPEPSQPEDLAQALALVRESTPTHVQHALFPGSESQEVNGSLVPAAQFRQQFDENLNAFLQNIHENPDLALEHFRVLWESAQYLSESGLSHQAQGTTQDLIRLRRFYRAALEFSTTQRFRGADPVVELNHDHLQAALAGSEQGLNTLREFLRASVRERGDLGSARLAAQISLELNHFAGLTMDLRSWEATLSQLDTRSPRNREIHLENHLALLRAWTAVRHAHSQEPEDSAAPPIPLTDAQIEIRQREQAETVIELLRCRGEISHECLDGFEGRLHAAINEVDEAFLVQLNLSNIDSYLTHFQYARVLTEDGGDTEAGPGLLRTLQAASLFGALGQGELASDLLAQAEEEIAQLPTLAERIEGRWQVAQLYQAAGLTEATERLLSQVEAEGGTSADPAHRELALRARALRQIQGGELSEAEATLSEIAEVPGIAQLQEGLQQGQRMRREVQVYAIWQLALNNYLEQLRSEENAQVAEIETELTAALTEAHGRVLRGECDNIDQAMGQLESSRVQHYLYSDHTQAHQLRRLSNLDLSEADFAQAVLDAAGGFLRAERYHTAAGLAQLFRDNEHVGPQARELIADLPDTMAWDSILTSLANMSIIFAEDAGDAVIYAGITLATFGVAEFLAVEAEVAYGLWSLRSGLAAAGRMGLDGAVRSGIYMGTSSAVLTSSELIQMGCEGHGEYITPGLVLRSFAANMVMFGLLRGTGSVMGRLSRPMQQRLAMAEAAAAQARRTGVGVELATQRLGRARSAARGMMLARWGSRVGALTGSEYANEALGFRESSGSSLGMRLLHSAVIDAQMMIAARAVNAASGGRMERRRADLHQRYAEHAVELAQPDIARIIDNLDHNGIIDRTDPMALYLRSALEASVASTGQTRVAEVLARARGRRAIFRAMDGLGLEPGSRAYDMAVTSLIMNALTQSTSRGGLLRNIRNQGEQLHGQGELLQRLAGQMAEAASGLEGREVSESEMAALRDRMLGQLINRTLRTEWSNGELQEISEGMVSGRISLFVSLDFSTGEFLWDFRQSPVDVPSVGDAATTLPEGASGRQGGVALAPSVETMPQSKPASEAPRPQGTEASEIVLPAESAPTGAEMIPLGPEPANPALSSQYSWARRAAAMVGLGVGMEALIDPSPALAAVEQLSVAAEGGSSTGTLLGILGAGLFGAMFFRNGANDETPQAELDFTDSNPESPPTPLQEYLVQLGREGLPRSHGAILDALANYGPMGTPDLSGRVNSHHPTGEVLLELGRLTDLGLIATSSDGSGNFQLTARGAELRQVMGHFGLQMVVSPQGRAILYTLGQRSYLSHRGLLRDLGREGDAQLEAELNFLEDRGLLRITRDPVDANRTRYRLTPDGQDMVYHLKRQLSQLQDLWNRSGEDGGPDSPGSSHSSGPVGGSSALGLVAALTSGAGVLLSTQVAEAAWSTTGSGNLGDLMPLFAGGALSLGALAMASSSNGSGDGPTSGPLSWIRQKWQQLRAGASGPSRQGEPDQEPPPERQDGGRGGPYRDLPGSQAQMQERIEAALSLTERIPEDISQNLQAIRDAFPQLGESGQNAVLEALVPHLRYQSRQSHVLYLLGYLQNHLRDSQKIHLGRLLIQSIQFWDVRDYSIPVIRFLEQMGTQEASSPVMAEIRSQFENRTENSWPEAIHQVHLISLLPQYLNQLFGDRPQAQRNALESFMSMLPFLPDYVRREVVNEVFQWSGDTQIPQELLEPWAHFRHQFYEDYVALERMMQDCVNFSLDGPFKIFHLARTSPEGRLDPLFAPFQLDDNGTSNQTDSEFESTEEDSSPQGLSSNTAPPPPGGVFPQSGGIAQLYPFTMQDHPNLGQAQMVLATSVTQLPPRIVNFGDDSSPIVDPTSLSLRFTHGMIRNGHGHWQSRLKILASDAVNLGLVSRDEQGRYQLTENPWFLIYDHQNPRPPENRGGSGSNGGGLLSGLLALGAGGSALLLPEMAHAATEQVLASGGEGGILSMVGALLGMGALAMVLSPYRRPGQSSTPSQIHRQIEAIANALPQIQSIRDLSPSGVRQLLHQFINGQVATGTMANETQPITVALRQLHEAIRQFQGSQLELVELSEAFRQIAFPILMIPKESPVISEADSLPEAVEMDLPTGRTASERTPLTDFYPLENQRRVRDILDQVARDPAWSRHMRDLPIEEIHTALLGALNAYPILHLEQLGEALITLARIRDHLPSEHPERKRVEATIQEMQGIAEEWGVNDPRANALGAMSGIWAGGLVAALAGGMGPVAGILVALGLPLSSTMSVNGALLTRNILRYGWAGALNDLYEQLLPYRYPHYWLNLPRQLWQGTLLLMGEAHESLAERFPESAAIRTLEGFLSLGFRLLRREGEVEFLEEERFSISAEELLGSGDGSIPAEESEEGRVGPPLQVRVDPDLEESEEELLEEEIEIDVSGLRIEELEMED